MFDNKEELKFLELELKRLIVLEHQAQYVLFNNLQKKDNCGVTPEVIFGSVFGIARYHLMSNFKKLGGNVDTINKFELSVIERLRNEQPSYTLENYREKIDRYVR